MLNESFLFSDKSLALNIKKFEEGKNKFLFIIGLSGSGKTTLGKYLSKKYNVKLYELDTVLKNTVSHYQYNSGINPLEVYQNDIREEIENIKGRAIIEGPQLLNLWYDYIKPKYSENSSFIIMGLSHIKSTMRRLIRNTKGVDEYWRGKGKSPQEAGKDVKKIKMFKLR